MSLRDGAKTFLALADHFHRNPVKAARAWRDLLWFTRAKRQFDAARAASPDKSFATGKLYPFLTERFDSGGRAKGDYFHQDLLVAQLIFRDQPRRHIDVASRVDGFVTHVAAFRQIEVFDIRPLASSASNIVFRRMDIMVPDAALTACTDSLSCLHALEHFGLGRYGDPIAYDGHRRGFEALVRMLRPGGKLYFSVPIAETQRIEFNAHRVFALPYLLALFDEHGLGLDGFHYVDDEGELHRDADPLTEEARRGFGLHYGCGIFELKKQG